MNRAEIIHLDGNTKIQHFSWRSKNKYVLARYFFSKFDWMPIFLNGSICGYVNGNHYDTWMLFTPLGSAKLTPAEAKTWVERKKGDKVYTVDKSEWRIVGPYLGGNTFSGITAEGARFWCQVQRASDWTDLDFFEETATPNVTKQSCRCVTLLNGHHAECSWLKERKVG